MPTLEIKNCKDCPHHKIEREHWMDDCYRLLCTHEEQTNVEGITTKIHRDGGIRFNCPLDKKDEIIECPSCSQETYSSNSFCPNCMEDL